MDSLFNKDEHFVIGGYILDDSIRFQSTSGGAFSAIAQSYCDKNYVIFGAETTGLSVYHSHCDNIEEIDKYRKSKYSQSKIGKAYIECSDFLKAGKKVLFSGTPCQIAGLKLYLQTVRTPMDDLLTVEVVCEGVPSPLYIRKYEEALGSKIENIDYRYTGKSIFGNGKWDFQCMKITLENGKIIEKDRWFIPFWKIWLKHLMSRPSCYECKFAKAERVADITLGDLWGVHLYCPDLYGKNGGASLVVANNEKGKSIVKKAKELMYARELVFTDALKYQSPMRKTIDNNPQREEFINDLKSEMSYKEINKKWYDKPSKTLLWQKYIWGNRQKIYVWNLKNKILK
ncbi:MAG: Coenzyme F420 hydrogenase/dehydrogenase, beta subunit C-terminal domain [Lachnospiraceae bacterium]|nr:Coenzyme F420 hydrogenase/dehydrogenase, beta subunit C-terminal domain [Lachnospiraceae bacterium]